MIPCPPAPVDSVTLLRPDPLRGNSVLVFHCSLDVWGLFFFFTADSGQLCLSTPSVGGTRQRRESFFGVAHRFGLSLLAVTLCPCAVFRFFVSMCLRSPLDREARFFHWAWDGAGF